MNDLDYSEFQAVFFEEVDEHLATMESLLLDIQVDAVDPEQLDAIFRAAHSIKGGAAVFGFTEIASLTHDLEAVLDHVRKGLRPVSRDLIATLLSAGDLLSAMFAALRDETQMPTAAATTVSARLRRNLEPVDTGAVGAVGDGATGIRPTPPQPAPDSTSIRVAVQKVDALVNLVGELVIAQSMMLRSAAVDLDDYGSPANAAMAHGLGQLERITREVQEAAMAIRMLPMSFVFGRFPRLVRDLAETLGKDVALDIEGEATEVDKGLIEAIVDPLTHLVRNALDHGIETDAARIAAGKQPQGTVTLRAFHRGGSIMVEVIDDGAGLDRVRLLTKARERGMKVSDAMSDQEVFKLVFEPGFSTAAEVTDVSGRGVGMDVIRRNIRALGGNVAIDSVLGVGTCISIRFPLTLAILDGMSVAVGAEVFIVPLAHIVESLQALPEEIKTIGRDQRLIQVRGEYLPLFALHEAFDLPTALERFDQGIVVILESEGLRIGLMVDALLGQQQVVIKSIEANYRRVSGVAGATIMGDGRVALILDVPHFVQAGSVRHAVAA